MRKINGIIYKKNNSISSIPNKKLSRFYVSDSTVRRLQGYMVRLLIKFMIWFFFSTLQLVVALPVRDRAAVQHTGLKTPELAGWLAGHSDDQPARHGPRWVTVRVMPAIILGEAASCRAHTHMGHMAHI